ncbi:hypothetical protein F7731_23575 [Cytobacillus depressus]|uniref:Uncharacterized protein n=1 Tax=Cytobacillus depressus TaxID=1602942 RepID=A0A6L3UZL0_9BACI|nr:hypothetical protein [Cytobacillus depressus]KAB2328936.1 hypothetical protein F7731_23575 [Cytobacillus depressus]
MPEKKETAKKSTAKNISEANASSTEPTENKDIDLTTEEKTALDVQKASNSGNPYSGKFKLKDPDTQYAEPGFTLTGDQKAELPEEPSAELLARIRSGFIVKA